MPARPHRRPAMTAPKLIKVIVLTTLVIGVALILSAVLF